MKPIFETVHKEADAEPGGADRLHQSFLRDLRNQRFRFSRIPTVYRSSFCRFKLKRL
jgi:hypothetical protein